MSEIFFPIIIGLLVVNLWLTQSLKKHRNDQMYTEVMAKVAEIEKALSKLENSNKDEFSRNRDEANKNARDARQELSASFKNLGDSILRSMAELINLQVKQLENFSHDVINLTQATEQKLEKMRETIENKLQAIQDDNNQKIEKMRETVDEKLHKTLEQRLGESFKLVSERLELVHKGLGEMQSLATGVGDLKRVLSNVKARGILGEIQLENILEQILNPDQYVKNIVLKENTRENVEFAVKLPGKDEDESIVYLPLDSKFPLEDYYSLIDAYDSGDQLKIESAAKNLEISIKKSAKDIRDKYLNPPYTTDFGIMFFPIEGLYAEVVRRTGLLEVLQREYKIIITGPTTLAALLNSLQMGFRTLAIEKRSSQVWKILGAVKTEFEKFGDVLNKAQDKISQASSEIEKLVGTRTRQIQRKLKDIQSITQQEANLLIAASATETDEEE